MKNLLENDEHGVQGYNITLQTLIQGLDTKPNANSHSKQLIINKKDTL